MDLKKKHAYKSILIFAFLGMFCIGIVFLISAPSTPFSAYKIETTEDIAVFFSEMNFKIDVSNIESKTSIIPNEFDQVFEEYNTLQQTQNCDLKNYAGKTVQIYTVPILNYGTTDHAVFATIIVHNKKIIGGDIHSAELNGFMHTLR